MRLLLITGAGGAGVTTFAAATALLAAERGRRTTLLATDLPSVEAALGPRAAWPATLAVHGPTPESIAGADAADVLAWLRSLLAWSGLDEAFAGDLALLPGSPVVAALLAAVDQATDLAVLDLGSAREALPVLHLLCTEPSSSRGMDAFGDLAARLMGPLVTRLVDLPRPSDAVRGAGAHAADRARRLRMLLRDASATSVRLLLPADDRAGRIDVEAETVLGLHGIGMDAFVCRGAAPVAGRARSVAPRWFPWSADVPRGCAGLATCAATVYGQSQPEDLLAPVSRPRIELTDAGADLVVPLPERPAADFGVSRQGMRLELRAGVWRRTFYLPPELQVLRGRRAWHDGEVFRVRFER